MHSHARIPSHTPRLGSRNRAHASAPPARPIVYTERDCPSERDECMLTLRRLELRSSDDEQEVRHIPEGVELSHLCPLLTRGVVAHSTASDMRPRQKRTGTPPCSKNWALLASRRGQARVKLSAADSEIHIAVEGPDVTVIQPCRCFSKVFSTHRR